MREKNVSSVWIEVNGKELSSVQRCSQRDSRKELCWTLLYDSSQAQLCLASSSCWEKHFILCTNNNLTRYSRLLVVILSLVSVSVLISLLLVYLKRRQREKRRRQFIDQAILSLQDLSLLD